jgi:7,8-dihydropterin-6-yl-methyl-4-(beta-D-ribofuranosyl)aminobenzene 5'-phosphate synthase
VPTPPARASHAQNLYDAFGKDGPAEKDWGFSAIVEYRGHTILFDAGRSADIFARNVHALGVDLRRVDIAVISHAHVDHTSGIDYLLSVDPKVVIYAPFDGDLGAPFMKATSDPAADALPPELRYTTREPPPSTGRFWHADVRYVAKSAEIVPGVTLITTESPFLGAYNKYPRRGGAASELSPLPELSLSLATDKGEVLIVGCSHSGVDRIVKETKVVVKRDVDLVMGGFHLFPFDEETIRALARTLKDDLGVRRVAPAHCTGHIAFRVLKETFGQECLYAGLGTDVVF